MGIDFTKGPVGAGPPAPGAAPHRPIVLTKTAPSVSLSKTTGASGTMRVNLNWDARSAASPGGGFLSRVVGSAPAAIDLDLGCLYEWADGTKGCVQALGGAFRDANPGNAIVWLDGDDRSGATAGGETMYIDLARLAEIRRIAVFALIYDGAPNWAAADGVVTVHPVGQVPITVRLDEPGSSRMCAITMLENVNGSLVIHRLVHHFAGHQPMDAHYGWGLTWRAGHK